MKLAKKLLVAMLALALLTSAFLFNVNATDAFNAPGIDDIEDILEYYTLEDYLADNYNDGTWTSELVVTDKDWASSSYPRIDVSAKPDPTNPDNGVLGVKLPLNKKSGYEMAAAVKTEGLTDQLFLTFKIYFDESVVDNLIYELKVGTVDDTGKASASQFTILRFNFSKRDTSMTTGFYYSTWNPNTKAFGSDLTAVEGVAPETGKWYDVVISVNAAQDFYSFDIKELDGTSVVSKTLPMEGAKAIWGFNCYGQYNYAKGNKTVGAQYYLDDMEIYEGSYVRYPSRRDEVTTTHLQDLDAIYTASTATYETKYRVAKVLDYLYNEAGDAFTVGAVLPNAQKYINETYAQAFSDAAAKINATATYDERVAYLDTLAFYDGKLPAPAALNGAAGITAELEAAVVAARAAYTEESSTLATIKAQSDAFLALIAEYDDANKDYVYVTEFLTEASDAKYAKRDASYAGIAAANEIYAGLKAKAERMIGDVNAFITAVEKMEAATTFGPLFLAYVDANASYTKYGTPALINPDLDNTTKTGLNDKIASYESKVDTILATAFICDEFNRIIKEATISSYYTTLVAEIEEATVVRAQFGEYEMDYPGLTESVAAYEAFKTAIDASKSAVEAYITAVNAIATKTTFAEKKAAVNAALTLKATGDVLGAEGVVEANIALTAAEAEINFLEGSSTTLISLVEEIKVAKTLAEKRALIHLANVSAANAEDTYTGVSAAKADLAAEIAAFEAAVAAANGALDAALKSAQALVYSIG